MEKFKVGSKIPTVSNKHEMMNYALSSCGLFSVQFICSFSRIARYTPSLTDILSSENSLAI
jgi:hypothetical protein